MGVLAIDQKFELKRAITALADHCGNQDPRIFNEVYGFSADQLHHLFVHLFPLL